MEQLLEGEQFFRLVAEKNGLQAQEACTRFEAEIEVLREDLGMTDAYVAGLRRALEGQDDSLQEITGRYLEATRDVQVLLARVAGGAVDLREAAADSAPLRDMIAELESLLNASERRHEEAVNVQEGLANELEQVRIALAAERDRAAEESASLGAEIEETQVNTLFAHGIAPTLPSCIRRKMQGRRVTTASQQHASPLLLK